MRLAGQSFLNVFDGGLAHLPQQFHYFHFFVCK